MVKQQQKVEVKYCIHGGGIKIIFNALLYTDETAELRRQNLAKALPGLELVKIIGRHQIILPSPNHRYRKIGPKK